MRYRYHLQAGVGRGRGVDDWHNNYVVVLICTSLLKMNERSLVPRKGKCTLNMNVLQTLFAETRLVKTVWQEAPLPQEMYLSWELQQKLTFWLCNMKWNWPTEVRIIAAPSGRGVYGAKATCRLKTSEQQPKPSAQDHHTYWTYWPTQPPLCLTLAKYQICFLLLQWGGSQ